MATFNLQDYATVEERLKAFMTDHPDARIITKNITTLQDRQVSTWVVQTEIWLPVSDFKFIANQAGEFAGTVDSPSDLWVLKSTGLAFEVDSNKGPQATSALEVCETSSVGRALMLAGYSGNKKGLASREEMEKVQRGVTPQAPVASPEDDIKTIEVSELIQMASSKDELRAIWQQNAAILDRTVELSTGKHTLKSLIMSRQAEVN